jgi:hypothetical protein
MDKLDYTALKLRHRDERAGYPQTLSLRIHRALSWLQRAEQEDDDPDAQFIFLWIAFNAAYAQDLSRQTGFSERRVFMNFLERLIDSDSERLLAETFDRLYTLRIQLLHGGATWAGGVNRTQIEQGAEILGLIVPVVIHMMMESPNQLWGEACYPVVD